MMTTHNSQEQRYSQPMLSPLSTPVIETLDDVKVGKYYAGKPIQTDTGLVFASKNGWVQVIDYNWYGYKSDQVMLVQEKTTLDFSLGDKSMNSFSFDYFSLHGSKSSVNLYDDNGALIANVPLSVTGSPGSKSFIINNFSYTPPAGVRLGRVEIVAGDEPGAGDVGFNIDNISWGVAAPLPAEITLDNMTKDSGSSALDFLTNDGSAVREVNGSLSRYLSSDEHLEWWDGSTWQPVNVSGQSWSLTDTQSHSDDWQYKLRVVNKDVAGVETTFDITLDTTPSDVQVLFTSMSKDNGADTLDWKTTDGSAGRNVTGRLDKALDTGDVIEYSVDGVLWQQLAVKADLSWSFVDSTAHAADWQYQIRITDKAGNQTPHAVQKIELYPEAAIISRVKDDFGSSKGDLSDGMMTDDRTPGIYGTAPAGSMVTLYNGAQILAQVLTSKEGNWQWIPPANLDVGAYAFSAVASFSGKDAAPSNTYNVVIVPSASITQLIDNVGLETGPQINGASIDDSTPELSGEALAGSVVYLYDKGQQIASVQVKNDGAWTWDASLTFPSGMALGDHSITATFAKDGYTSDASAPWKFTYVLTAPTAVALIDSMTKDSGLSNTDFITNDASAGRLVKGHLSEALKAGEKVQLWDGSNWVDATVTNGTDWSATDSQAHSGNWQYKTRVINLSNASGSEEVQNVVLDTQGSNVLAQFISMTKDNGDDTNDWKTSDGDAGRTVKGKFNKALSNGDSAEYSLDNGVTWQQMNVWPDQSWNFIDTQSHSANWQYQVRIIDIAGNVSPVVKRDVSYALPPLAPVITQVMDDVAGGVVGNVKDKTLTNDNTPTVQGTGQPNGKIILVMTQDSNNWSSGATRSIEVPVGADGRWQVTINNPALADSEWYFRPKSVDDFGYEGSLAAEWSIILDTVTSKPVIEFAQDNVAGGKQNGEDIGHNGITNDPRPVLKGSAEAGSLLRIYNKNNKEIGSTLVGSDGEWTFKLPAQADGTHTFTAKATDLAGNVSESSDPYIIEVDIFVPAPFITAGLDNVGSVVETILQDRITDDATPEFYGSAAANSVVWLYDHGIFLGSYQADAKGNWRGTLPQLQDGLHQITAYSHSESGAISTASAPYNFQVGNLWDFNSGMGGWTIVGDHAKNNATYLQSSGNGRRLMFETPTGGNYSGDIMRRQIDVVAGETYDFSFILTRVSYWTLTNPAKLAFKINGISISSYYTVQDAPQKVEGVWKATTTGKVTLSIHNLVASGTGNDFWIDDIAFALHKKAGPVNVIKQMLFDADNAREALSEEISSIKSLANEVKWDEIKSSGLQSEVIDTLHVEGENQQLVLGEMRQHLKAVNTINITGSGHNTLSISLEDIMALGGDDLFVNDKTLQLQIRGDEGDVINLDSVFKGEDFGHWTQQSGSITIGGISYNVYKHDSLDVQLIAEDGIKANLI